MSVGDYEASLQKTLPEDTPFGQDEVFADRYRILRSLGRGGMGAVYQAEDRHVGDVVALKLITMPGALDSKTVERFRREVRLARRITHRNVARIHDLESYQGVHFLTMEFVEGDDLERRLADKGPFSPKRAARCAAEICEALAAAHEAEVVHRDLKPGNVLLETSGRVVVTDFGIARPIGEGEGAAVTGVIGTPTYMAPEQVQGHAVDERADLYALGILLYEMLVGEPPFCESTAIATAMARLQQPVPDPRKRADVPDTLADLVRCCLQREPDARPRTAQEVRAMLSTVVEEPTPAPEKRSSPADTGRSRSDSLSPGGERRHVAVLFADLAEIETGGRAVDPEEMDEALSHCFEIASDIVHRHGGEIERQPGGGAMVTFGWPVARGNDTERAARTALELHAELANQQPPLRIRVGLASGHVVVRPGQAPVGGPLVQATRLREAAAPGETRLDDAARVALGERARCDRPEENREQWTLVGLRAPDAEADRPFVGRRSELRLLEEVLESCREEHEGS
ncbi:MAG: serine/threonine protein kinase, partial [Myxococcota bacterium]